MQRAALYARVSTAEQAEGHSIDAQLEKLRAYAKDNTCRVFEEYIDPGFQGDTGDRPALRRLLFDARERKFDVVLVYRFDRFFRDVRLFLNAEYEFREHGIRLVSITEAFDDTHEGRLQLLIKGSFAEYEKAVIRERANLGRMEAAREGKWMGGPPPYGYDLDPKTSKLVVNQEEAKWVRKFFTWLVKERLSLQALQKRVNDLAIPTKWENLGRARPVNRKGWWMKRTLGRILTNELYTGTYHYRKFWKPRSVKRKDAKERPQEEWIPIKVPRIISNELFRLAQQQLKKNSELSPRRTNRSYLLRRLIECGTCGRAWIATNNNFGRAYYICSGRREGITSERCQTPSVSALKLEPLVWNSIQNLLRNPELVFDRVRKRLDQEGTIAKEEECLQRLSQQLEKALGEEDRLIKAYKEGLIDFMTFKIELNETRERVSRLREEKDRLSSQLAGWLSKEAQLAAVERFGRQVLDKLPKLSYEARCELVRQLVERVIVKPEEIEIYTIVPDSGPQKAEKELVVLRDERGVDRPAKQQSKIGVPINPDPAKVVRITLFADLPVVWCPLPKENIRKAA